MTVTQRNILRVQEHKTQFFFVLKRYAQEVNFNFAGMGGGISKGQCIFLKINSYV
jgi:hypothetical protein